MRLPPVEQQPIGLRRSVSLPLLVFYGVGNILGAGIYVLLGKVAGVAGYPAPLAFFMASAVAAFTAFAYAELSARYPLSGGEAVYLDEGFGRAGLSMTVGLLIVIGGLVSVATIARGFVGYLDMFVTLPHWLSIVSMLVCLGAVACWGITQSVALAGLFTVVEIAGLLVIMWVGRDAFGDLPQRFGELMVPTGLEAWPGIVGGAFLAFYAYIGFEDMVNIAEEVKRPQRNMPLGILLALLIATLLYAGVAVVAVLLVEPRGLAGSDAPLALVYETATGRRPVAIGLISMAAVMNGALIQLIMVSRILYGMSCRGWIPAMLSTVNPRTRTPLHATVLVIVASAVLALFVPLVTLASITSFVVLLVFAFVNLALVRVKRREPRPVGVRTYPRWVPVVGFATSAGLIGARLLTGN